MAEQNTAPTADDKKKEKPTPASLSGVLLDFTGGLDLDGEDVPDYDGPQGPRKWLGYTGLFRVKIDTVFSDGVSKKGNNQMLGFHYLVDEEEPGVDGKPINVELKLRFVPVTGLDKNGKPNAWRLAKQVESYLSAEMSDEEAKKAAKELIHSKSADLQVIAENMIGRTAYIKVDTEQYSNNQGQTCYKPKVLWTVTRGEYEKTPKALRRQPVSAQAAAWYESVRNQRQAAGGALATGSAPATSVATGLPTAGAPAAPAAGDAAAKIAAMMAKKG